MYSRAERRTVLRRVDLRQTPWRGHTLPPTWRLFVQATTSLASSKVKAYDIQSMRFAPTQHMSSEMAIDFHWCW